MIFEFSNLTIGLLNGLGIPAAHLGIAWLSLQLPSQIFDTSNKTVSQFEKSLHERLFLVRKWKHRLPDAAPWFGGFAKKGLNSRDVNYLKKFVLETRRGEFSHWLQWLVISFFMLWTPWPYALTIGFYAALSNLPCIINLRYTRLRLISTLKKLESPSN